MATGAVTTLAGSGDDGDADGVGAAAQFSGPTGIALSTDGGMLFVADTSNHTIRQVDVATGAVTTLAGSGEDGLADGVASAAMFNGPQRLALSSDGAALFIADIDNDKIRQLDVATGAVTTLAECKGPADFAVDPNGAELIVGCARQSHKLMRVKLKTNTMPPLVIPPSTCCTSASVSLLYSFLSATNI